MKAEPPLEQLLNPELGLYDVKLNEDEDGNMVFDYDVDSKKTEYRNATKDLIAQAREDYDKVIVLFNICNTMEMGFLEEIGVDAALMIWAPSEAGLTSVTGILAGEINPSGKLADTITYNIADHPSSENFGD